MRKFGRFGVGAIAAALCTGMSLLVAPAAAAHDGTPCDGRADACVDLIAKVAWLMRDGHVYYGPVAVNTGKPGYRTPPGDFTVKWKNKDHWSQAYDAPMPYAVFFTNDGIAFHQGDVRRQSHGCVRMWRPAAQKFFYELQVGELVQVRR